jgi:hypothetical protein
MKQSVAVLLLAPALPGRSKSPPTSMGVPGFPPAADTAPASPGAGVRKELEANYAGIVDGFKNNDPSVWEGFQVPGFRLGLFDGRVQDRQWVSHHVRHNAKTFTVVSLGMRFKGLTLECDDATVIVEQKSCRTFTDEHKQRHQLVVDAVQREVCTRTTDGMRLKLVAENKVLYPRPDGTPMSQ